MQHVKFTPELVAPCGMNCAICSGYLALRYDVKNKGIRMPYCEGCRPRDKKCAFLKKTGKLLLDKKVEFCYECEDFPCERLKHLDKRYQTLFRTSLIANLESMRKYGTLKFLEIQKEKWQCPKCGEVLCCHNGICFNCDLDKLQKKKKLYRWEDE
jgi:hypothetical protein